MNIPLGKWSGSDAVESLHASIKEFNAQSSKQTDQMLRLTWIMAVLTLVMMLGLVVQIYLVFYPPAAPTPAPVSPSISKNASPADSVKPALEASSAVKK
jgi:hypothetical protein